MTSSFAPSLVFESKGYVQNVKIDLAETTTDQMILSYAEDHGFDEFDEFELVAWVKEV